MKPASIVENISYTFADYFKLNLDSEDVVAHFGYTFQAQNYKLPSHATLDLEPLLISLVSILTIPR